LRYWAKRVFVVIVVSPVWSVVLLSRAYNAIAVNATPTLYLLGRRNARTPPPMAGASSGRTRLLSHIRPRLAGITGWPGRPAKRRTPRFHPEQPEYSGRDPAPSTDEAVIPPPPTQQRRLQMQRIRADQLPSKPITALTVPLESRIGYR